MVAKWTQLNTEPKHIKYVETDIGVSIIHGRTFYHAHVRLKSGHQHKQGRKHTHMSMDKDVFLLVEVKALKEEKVHNIRF